MTTLAKLEFPDPQIPWLSSRAWLLPGGTTRCPTDWDRELGSRMLNIWKMKSLFANVTWALHRCGDQLGGWLESPLRSRFGFPGPAFFCSWRFFFEGGPFLTTFLKWEWLFWNTLPLMLCCLTLLPPPKRIGHAVRKKNGRLVSK